MPRALILVDSPSVDHRWGAFGVATRHLAPVLNKPLIAHAFDALRDAGIKEIAVLADRGAKALIEPALAEHPHAGASVRYVERSRRGDVAAALLDAEPFVGDHPTVLHTADAVVASALGGALSSFFERGLDALFAAENPPVSAPPVEAAASTTAQPQKGVGSGGEPRFSGLCVVNRVATLAAKEAARRTAEPRFSDLLKALRALGADVEYEALEGWYRCSEPPQLLKATYAALDNLAHDAALSSLGLPGNEVEGRVMVHPTSKVEASRIRGPVALGARCRVSQSCVGPYVSIGDDAVLEGAEVAGSVVLDGALVSHPPARLDCSILGRGARVTSGYELPRGLRLTLCNGGEVSFS